MTFISRLLKRKEPKLLLSCLYMIFHRENESELTSLSGFVSAGTIESAFHSLPLSLLPLSSLFLHPLVIPLLLLDSLLDFLLDSPQ